MCRKVFFYKQKTAYEMRISDWSSDVCSSDLGIDRAIETDVGRNIARDDRLWMLGGYRGAQRRRIAVDGLGRVEPVAAGLAVQRAGADGTRNRPRAAAGARGAGRGGPRDGRARGRGRGGADGVAVGGGCTFKKKKST